MHADQEFLQTLADMEVYWLRQFKQNYTRSLDHRSFYFKVIDKKVLGLRHIVQEIKDAAEATQQAPEKALSVHTSAPASVQLRPDVILEMPDKYVTELCHVQQASGIVCLPLLLHTWQPCADNMMML